MSIRVTCGHCHTRFNVSEKFAGKEGPCPKCKKMIRVPAKEEEVVIAAPDTGVKDSKGRSIVKPIRRAETKLSQVQLTIIGVCVVGFLLAALMLRVMTGGAPDKFPVWLLGMAALLIAPPIIYVAYQMLRDTDLGTFDNNELRNRVLICTAIYSLLWLGLFIGKYVFNDNWELGSWLTGMIPMLALGATAGMLLFDMEFLLGLVHYGMYVGICLIGRWIAGIGVLPGWNEAAIVADVSTAVSINLGAAVHVADVVRLLSSTFALFQ
jgi:hypothetical protein